MNKKTIAMLSLCVGLAVMAIAYAAFQSQLTVTVGLSGTGLDVKMSCKCNTGVAGLSGATVPTATCTPGTATNTTTGTMAATLYQPGDEVTCEFTIKNDSAFDVKVNNLEGNGEMSCTSLSTPFISNVDAILAQDTVIAKNGGTAKFTIEMGYLNTITSQPSTTSGSMSCTVPLVQVG